MNRVQKRRLKKVSLISLGIFILLFLLFWLISSHISKQITLARETLFSVVSYATICVDDGFPLGDTLDDNDTFTPQVGTPLCHDSKVPWPLLPRFWSYNSASSSVFKATFEYGAEGNGVRVRCTQAGCEESFVNNE